MDLVASKGGFVLTASRIGCPTSRAPAWLFGGIIMNNLVRRLLSGASVVTLQLCAVGAARASAGLTINGPTGSVIGTAGKTPDYIYVTNTGAITGSLTNEGTVGLTEYGLTVDGSITGSLINAKT